MASPSAVTFQTKKPGQRACHQKDAKGKLCVGHLKRWYTPTEDIIKELGKNAEIYRCERCNTLYRPAPEDHSTAGLNYDVRPVNLLGWAVRKDRAK